MQIFAVKDDAQFFVVDY